MLGNWGVMWWTQSLDDWQQTETEVVICFLKPDQPMVSVTLSCVGQWQISRFSSSARNLGPHIHSYFTLTAHISVLAKNVLLSPMCSCPLGYVGKLWPHLKKANKPTKQLTKFDNSSVGVFRAGLLPQLYHRCCPDGAVAMAVVLLSRLDYQNSHTIGVVQTGLFQQLYHWCCSDWTV